MENLFFNQHILENVFGFCKVTNLLCCRLVCKTWNEESSRILKKKAIITLRTEEALSDYIICMNESQSNCLPYCKYVIECPVSFQSGIVYTFLDTFRFSFKNIKFEYHPQPHELTPHEVSQNNSHGILTLPELESLHLFSTQFSPSDNALSMPFLYHNLCLPKLSCLFVQHLHDTECKETIVKLINSSKQHVEKLKVPCSKFLEIVSETNLKQLKDLNLCEFFPGSSANNKILMTLTVACPKLTRLSIEFGHRVTTEYTQSLFNTLSGTLEYLKLTIQDRGLLSRQPSKVNLHFPKMFKLKTLNLRFSNPALTYFIDRMPKLTALELDTPWQRRIRGNIYPGVKNVYSKISSLKLSEILTINDVEELSQSFPNLKILCSSFENNNVLYKVYEKFQGLQKLVIERKSRITDAGICGIPDESLEKIRNNFVGEMENNFWDLNTHELRQYPSIGNLPNLQAVELCQRGFSCVSLLCGVLSLKDLRSLTIETITLKIGTKSLVGNDSVIRLIRTRFPMLANLTLWIMHHDQKLTEDEAKYLHDELPQLEITILRTIVPYVS